MIYHLCVFVAGAAQESVIVLMLRRRATDEKVGVRKAALLALEGIIRLNITNISRDVSYLALFPGSPLAPTKNKKWWGRGWYQFAHDITAQYVTTIFAKVMMQLCSHVIG